MKKIVYLNGTKGDIIYRGKRVYRNDPEHSLCHFFVSESGGGVYWEHDGMTGLPIVRGLPSGDRYHPYRVFRRAG